ncbi:hypothetical protein LOZ52_006353 [Ophidiomyces ophidiicola]|nr:hypothetical protein LOZ64_006079 [Ophidiomyces ophidiicola]KAI2001287.1 hypothetical protein LOZ50_005781 [Ophidiomyces ophidiicola]KAI2004806.1 hypothetical protein LOZ49_005711 [Ophidiomyces ophidiicola]KAI2010689.1 hypothetical protein LOZ46_006262 [Ophidiomyces ophidiicola]KAI2129568.1 hypothetical protein LOZ29_006021 [Ophidiomyces ophidiicola]
MIDSGELPWWMSLRIWAGKKLYGDTSSMQVFYIGRRSILKRRCHLSELEAIEYVRTNTTIPVPAIYKVYGKGDYRDVVLERLPGHDLAHAWRSLTAKQKSEIVKELAGYVSQLRQLQPPKKGVVGSPSLGPGYDHRLGGQRFGPFNLTDFHNYVRRSVDLESWKARDESVSQVHNRSNTYATKFTHADLSPSNIIVADGKILGIIDWEFGGWFPEYWEYTKIYFGFRDWRKDFYSEVESAFTVYPEELDAEQAIWLVTGPFDYYPATTVVTN